jgi:hypothetical protein
MQPTITATLEAIREKLGEANIERNRDWQTGDMLIALSLITEVLEAQQRRIDAIDEQRRVDRICREHGI